MRINFNTTVHVEMVIDGLLKLNRIIVRGMNISPLQPT